MLGCSIIKCRKRVAGLLRKAYQTRSVRRALGEVPEEYREVLCLKLGSRLSFEDLAAEVGVTTEVAKRRYYRAVVSFAEVWNS